MMKCSKSKTFLTDYLNGHLDPPLMEQLDKHLAVCGECARELKFLKTYLPAAASVAKVNAPPLFVENLMCQIDHPASHPFRRIQMVPAALCSVIIILLLAFYIYQPLNLRSLPGAGEDSAMYQSKRELQPMVEKTVPAENQTAGQVANSMGEAGSKVLSATKSGVMETVLLTLVLNSAVSSVEQLPLRQEQSMELKKASQKMAEDASLAPLADVAELQGKESEVYSAVNPAVRITDIVKSLDGIFVDRVYTSKTVSAESTGAERNITFRLPSRNYQQLVAELNGIGVLASCPQVPAKDGAMLEVRLEIIPQ